MIADSHAHLTDPRVFSEIDLILERAKNAGVERIVNIATDLPTLEKGMALSKKYPWIALAAATTPHDVEKEGEEVFPFVEKAAKTGLLQAIGESGLDYYYEHSNRELQKQFFCRYLQLAHECHLPIIIHCREAFADLFALMDAQAPVPFILHCFTGTQEQAEEVVRRGGYISFSGIVTFKKSESLQQVAKWVPLDHLLIETDAPYLAPQGHRGKQNEPAFIIETARFLAALKGLIFEELTAVTSTNLARVLKLEARSRR